MVTINPFSKEPAFPELCISFLKLDPRNKFIQLFINLSDVSHSNLTSSANLEEKDYA